MIKAGRNRQSADKFRDQAKPDKVIGLHPDRGTLLRALGFIFSPGAKAKRAPPEPLFQNLTQPIEGAPANEKDMFRIDLDVFLLRMLSPPLRRHIGRRSLQDLQEGLLNTFPGHITGNGYVLRPTADLVDLIDIYDPHLGPLHVVIRRLEKPKQYVLDVLAHVARLSQGRCIRNRKRHIQNPGQCFGQQRLAASRRADQQDIALFQLHVRMRPIADPVGRLVRDALVVVVNGNRQDFLRLFLPNHVLVKFRLDFVRLE